MATCPRYGYRLLGAHAWWGNRFLSGIRVLRCDYSRVTRVSITSYDSSNKPAVFAYFWLRRGCMVLQPHLYCLTSRFTHVRSLYWVLGLCGVRQGYGCVGNGHCDDYSADSSASLAQCCSCGVFFPSFAIFPLVWGLLFFLVILAFIPRLHFWCYFFYSACLFSSSLSPKAASLGCFSCRPPYLVVPVYVFGVSFCGSGAVSSSSPPTGCGVGSC